jgi:ferric-dicitrate binding protein FerR (iron transport regulator)
MKKEFPIIVMGALTTLMCSSVQCAETSPRKEARIIQLTGEVFIGRAETPKSEKAAAVDDRLRENEWLRTGKAALAELKFGDSTSVRLAPRSKFRYFADTSNFALEEGEGIFSFPKGEAGFTVSTPLFAAGIEGTTVYVKVSRNVVEYACLEGRCRIGPHALTSGEKLVLRGSSPPYAAPKQPLSLARFLKENKLVTSFVSPLPNLRLIESESAKQKQSSSRL